MAEQPTYEFAEVKDRDIIADRITAWEGFTKFITWSTAAMIVMLVLIYLIWG